MSMAQFWFIPGHHTQLHLYFSLLFATNIEVTNDAPIQNPVNPVTNELTSEIKLLVLFRKKIYLPYNFVFSFPVTMLRDWFEPILTPELFFYRLLFNSFLIFSSSLYLAECNFSYILISKNTKWPWSSATRKYEINLFMLWCGFGNILILFF